MHQQQLVLMSVLASSWISISAISKYISMWIATRALTTSFVLVLAPDARPRAKAGCSALAVLRKPTRAPAHPISIFLSLWVEEQASLGVRQCVRGPLAFCPLTFCLLLAMSTGNAPVQQL